MYLIKTRGLHGILSQIPNLKFWIFLLLQKLWRKKHFLFSFNFERLVLIWFKDWWKMVWSSKLVEICREKPKFSIKSKNFSLSWFKTAILWSVKQRSDRHSISAWNLHNVLDANNNKKICQGFAIRISNVIMYEKTNVLKHIL